MKRIWMSVVLVAQFSSVQSLSCVQLFATPWIAARQASLSITNSRSSLKHTSIESVMPSSHLILCRPLLLLPPIPPSIRVFSNKSTLRMRWPKYWSFSSVLSNSLQPHGLYLPGPSVHGILQARILEWVAISFSNNMVFRKLKDWDQVPCLIYHVIHQGLYMTNITEKKFWNVLLKGEIRACYNEVLLGELQDRLWLKWNEFLFRVYYCTVSVY